MTNVASLFLKCLYFSTFYKTSNNIHVYIIHECFQNVKHKYFLYFQCKNKREILVAYLKSKHISLFSRLDPALAVGSEKESVRLTFCCSL